MTSLTEQQDAIQAVCDEMAFPALRRQGGDCVGARLKEQQDAIQAVCDEMAIFLQGKNTSYDGSAFKDVVYAGRYIQAVDTLDVRITDKIRRLQSANPTFDGQEDSEQDLLGYLILKCALKRLKTGGTV